MLAFIRKLLAPPVFEDDEDKTRTARVLNAILLAMLLSWFSLVASPCPLSLSKSCIVSCSSWRPS